LKVLEFKRCKFKALKVLEFKRCKFKALKVLEYDLLVLDNFDWIMEAYSLF